MKSTVAASVFVGVWVPVTGMCTTDERMVLQDAHLVGTKGNDCGVKSFNTISFEFQHVEFNNCFSDELSISLSCAECYASVVEYGMRNCFPECSRGSGWCASGCLSCTAHAWENRAALGACSGFKNGGSEPCDQIVPESTMNSSDPEIDRCSVCTDDCDGCPGHEKPIDNVVVKFLAAHSEELKSQAQDLATQEGLNEAIQLFVPIRYKTQVVAGINWFIKVQFGSNSRSNMYADVVIFEPLASRNEPPKITNIKFGVARDAPIGFLNNESLMV